MLGLIYSLIAVAGKLGYDNIKTAAVQNDAKAAETIKIKQLEDEDNVFKQDNIKWTTFFIETEQIIRAELAKVGKEPGSSRQMRLKNLNRGIKSVRHNKSLILATQDLDQQYRSFLDIYINEYIELIGEKPVWEK